VLGGAAWATRPDPCPKGPVHRDPSGGTGTLVNRAPDAVAGPGRFAQAILPGLATVKLSKIVAIPRVVARKDDVSACPTTCPTTPALSCR